MTKARSNATAPAAKGEIVVGTGSDVSGILGVGSANQVLTVDSSTATGLRWGTVSAGGMTELASGTLSSTAVTLSSISQSYKNLQLVIRGPRVSAGTRLALRWNGLVGSNYNYVWREAAALTSSATALDRFWASVNDLTTTTTTTGHFVFDFLDYTSPTRNIVLGTHYEVGLQHLSSVWGNNTITPTEITDITITTQNGTSTFSAGTYILYGVS